MFKVSLGNEFLLSYVNLGVFCLILVIVEFFDVIFLDVCMFGFDGYDMCWLLKNIFEIVKIFVVMVFGFEIEFEKKVGFDVGCDVYVVKLFFVKIFIEKIKILV